MTKYFTKDDDGNYIEVEALSKDAANSILEERLKRQAEVKFGDYEELKQKAKNAEELKSEFDLKLKEANDRTASLETELTTAKLDATKVKLLSEFKLSDDMAESISGDDEDEMRRRAEKLAEKTPTADITIDKGTPKSDNTDNRALMSKLFGTSDD